MSDDKDKVRAEASELVKAAMAADAEIDKIKLQLNEQLQVRSRALDELQKRGIKRFSWQGLTLTIFRKGEGLWSLKGKKKDESNIFSID